MSLTDMFNSLIWRSRRMTSLCKKNISPSKLYHLSKYSLTIFFRSSSLADSMSFLEPHLSDITRWRSAAFLSCSFLSSSAAFFLSKVRSFFFLAILLVLCCVGLGCYKITFPGMAVSSGRRVRGQQPHNLNQMDRTEKMDGLFLLA